MTCPFWPDVSSSWPCAPSTASDWTLGSFQPGQTPQQCLPWGELGSLITYLRLLSQSHVRGWLGGRLEVQGVWVGKQVSVLGRPLGLGGWELDG